MQLSNLRQQTAARIARTEHYAAKVQRMFSETVNEILALPLTTKGVGQGTMYSFDAETAKVQRKAEQLLRRLQAATTMAIEKGVELEWGEANKAADAIIKGQFTKKALQSPMMRGWNARNLEAMRAFIERSDRGMNLSERVWQPCRQLRDEMEVALTISIGEGEDAGTISRRVRQYLNDPDLMFRRFRYKDENGNWQRKWKKRIKDPNNPSKYKFIDYDKEAYQDQWTGRGYYKSSAKNAMRVARTETNIAYRRADHERWLGLDFVLGKRVILSKQHPMPDICDQLSAPNKPKYDADDKRGVYPKEFVFDGWHPHCYCFATPILVDPEEIAKMNDAFVEGKEYTPQGEAITEYPQEFKDWIRDNADNIKASRKLGTEPYFVRNNASAVDEILNPKANAIKSTSPKEKKELTKDGINARFKELKDRIKEGGYKSEDITRFRTQIVNAILRSGAPLSDIDGMLDKLTDAVDKADAPRIQRYIDGLPPFKPTKVSVEMRSEYANAGHVAETLNKINDSLNTGQKWSEHGRISFAELIDAGASGSTKMDGVIKLSKDGLENMVSAFDKMAHGIEITKAEAESLATMWHEVNHNRNLWGSVRGDKGKLQTNQMELANEFVSRHTLGEFYSTFGIKKPPHQELMWRRSSVGYDDMVRCYDTIISGLGLNHGSVLHSVQTGLYRQPYDSQGDVLVSAIWENWSHKKNVPPINQKDIKKLVSLAVDKKEKDVIDLLISLGYSLK